MSVKFSYLQFFLISYKIETRYECNTRVSSLGAIGVSPLSHLGISGSDGR